MIVLHALVGHVLELDGGVEVVKEVPFVEERSPAFAKGGNVVISGDKAAIGEAAKGPLIRDIVADEFPIRSPLIGGYRGYAVIPGYLMVFRLIAEQKDGRDHAVFAQRLFGIGDGDGFAEQGEIGPKTLESKLFDWEGPALRGKDGLPDQYID